MPNEWTQYVPGFVIIAAVLFTLAVIFADGKRR